MRFRIAPWLLVLASMAAATTLAQTPAPRFATTNAQQNAPRVRQARQERLGDIRALFAKRGFEYPPAETLLRAFKSEDEVELWVRPVGKTQFVLIKIYSICARSGTLGPKRQQGDLQVPEGFYRVTQFHPDSQFHLSLRINYPNASDRIRATSQNPGGDILIHGDCVTIGCIPLTDRWIEELYLICLDTATRRGNHVQVQIYPTRLAGEPWETLRKEFAAQPQLLRFWEELKAGYDWFQETQTPGNMVVQKDGAYRLSRGERP